MCDFTQSYDAPILCRRLVGMSQRSANKYKLTSILFKGY